MRSSTAAMMAVVAGATLIAAADMPSEWLDAASRFDLFASNATGVTMMPALGNGVFGFEAGQRLCFHSGLFSGGSCSEDRSGRSPEDRASTNSASTPQIAMMVPTISVQGASASSAVWQAIDIRRAVFLRRYNLTLGGSTAMVSERQYAHFDRMQALVFETNVTVLSGSVLVSLGCEWGTPGDGLLSWADVDGSTRVGTVTEPEIPSSVPDRVAVHGTCKSGSAAVTPSSPLRRLSVVGLASTLTNASAEGSLLAGAAVAAASEAMDAGAGRLLSSHASSWARRWAEGGIEVELEPQSAVSGGVIPLPAAINSSLYGILASARLDWPHGVSPGGIATSAYNGNRFWDADSWVFPAVSMLYRDDVGLSLTRYRTSVAHISAAQGKAKAFGYEGAMYPWQSGASGRELQCGIWGNFEHHVTADVSLALLKMWGQMGGGADAGAMRWLGEEAWPVLRETARYWSSRVTAFNVSEAGALRVVPALVPPGGPAPSGPPASPVTVAHVMGPDEYYYNISTSTYTNAAAAVNLMASAAAARALNVSVAEAAAWEAKAARLVVLVNASTGVHPEFLTWTGADTSKQADTVLTGSLLTWGWQSLDPAGTERDVRYYLSHTTSSGPAMTWGAFLIGALRSGADLAGADLFARSFSNVQAPFWVWSETPTGGAPHFITGAGGFLQVFTSGYNGLYPANQDTGPLSSGAMVWRPHGPPPGASRLVLRGVDVGPCSLRLEVTSSTMAASVVGPSTAGGECGSGPTLEALTGGKMWDLPATLPLTAVRIVPRGPARASP